MLCFKAKTYTLIIYNTTFSFDSSVEEISCVNLYPWFVGKYFNWNTADRRCKFSCYLSNVTSSVQYPIMIITVSVFQLDIIEFINVLTYQFSLCKIHWCAGNGKNFSGSHKCTVYWSKFICVNIKRIFCYWIISISGQIKIGVVSHINNCFLICCSFIADVNSIICCQCISYFSCYFTWKICITVWWNSG